MSSIRFFMFLIASLVGHAAVLVPLSGYVPAVIDTTIHESKTVVVSINAVSHAEQNKKWVDSGQPYQAIDSMVTPELEQTTADVETEPLEKNTTVAPNKLARADAVKTESISTIKTDTAKLPADIPAEPRAARDSNSRQASAEVEVNRRLQVAAEEKYLTELLNAIAQHRFYPSSARRRGQQGSVEIDLTIHKTGEFRSIAVSKPSNHRTLNKASTHTLTRLKRFKPFPSEIDRETWRIFIPFRYVLNEGKDKHS